MQRKRWSHENKPYCSANRHYWYTFTDSYGFWSTSWLYIIYVNQFVQHLEVALRLSSFCFLNLLLCNIGMCFILCGGLKSAWHQLDCQMVEYFDIFYLGEMYRNTDTKAYQNNTMTPVRHYIVWVQTSPFSNVFYQYLSSFSAISAIT